jgi:hypothetical protein
VCLWFLGGGLWVWFLFGVFCCFLWVWFWVGEIGVFCACEGSWLDST